MSTPDPQAGQHKYYDPGEVEAYVADVTNTIKTLQGRLQEALRRAEHAEQEHREGDQPYGDAAAESASLGRALLLAGEVADKTIADADARAAEIVGDGQRRAAAIVEAAQSEARRVVDAAGGAAAEIFEKGEARLLAAVSAFVDGSNVLRSALARIEEDATDWRHLGRPPVPPQRQPPEWERPDSASSTPPPSPHQSGDAGASYGPPPDRSGPPDLPAAVHNGAGRNGFRRTPADAPPSDTSSFSVPPPAPGGPA